MLTIKKYKKLCRLLEDNGFRKSECSLEGLRNKWQKDLQLNRYKLEIAAQQQIAVFERWDNLCTDVSGLLEDENRQLRKLKSKKDLQVRSCPKRMLAVKYGIPDLKESAIKAVIELDPRIEKQEKRVLFLQMFYMKIKGVVKASEHRRGSIRILSDLYASSYFSKTTGKGTKLGKNWNKKRKVV